METRVETSAITIANPDVLASARVDLQRALDRGRYASREAWAREVLLEDDPVDLYEQRDGSLHLLDGNHRYLAAMILGVPLTARVHRSEAHARQSNPHAPTRWFHGTTVAAAAAILAAGKLVGPPTAHERYDGRGGKWTEPVPGLVYATNDLELALAYVQHRAGRKPGALIEVKLREPCLPDEDEIGAALEAALTSDRAREGNEAAVAMGDAILAAVPEKLRARWKKIPERSLGGWSSARKAKEGKAALAALPPAVLAELAGKTRSVACAGARPVRAWVVAPGDPSFYTERNRLADEERDALLRGRSPEQIPMGEYLASRQRAHERMLPKLQPLQPPARAAARRTNPAWVDAALTEAWPTLQASLAPPIVTKKGKKQHAEELGCGHYGCVLATSRPDVVLKVTTDPTEAAIVTLLLRHRDLQQDGIVRYLEVQKLPGARRGRALFAIWREAAYDVGDVVPLGRAETRDARDARYRLNRFKAWANEVRMTLGRQADPWPLLAEAQRPGMQDRARHYVDLAEGDVYGDPFPRKTDPWASARYGGGGRIEDAVVIKHWPIREQPLKLAVLLLALEQTAQFLGSNREAYLVGQALENLLDQGVLLADVHANNIGRVNRPDHEGAVVITDPGHAVFLRRELAEEAVAIAGAAAGTASKPKRAMNPACVRPEGRHPNDGGLGELGAAALVVGAMLPIVPPPGPGDLLTPLLVGGWVAHHHAQPHPHQARQGNPAPSPELRALAEADARVESLASATDGLTRTLQERLGTAGYAEAYQAADDPRFAELFAQLDALRAQYREASEARWRARAAAGLDPRTGKPRRPPKRVQLPSSGHYPDLLLPMGEVIGGCSTGIERHASRAGIEHTSCNGGRFHLFRHMGPGETAHAGLTLRANRPRGGKQTATIDRVFTDPAHRRRGYAAALLAEARRYFARVDHSRDLTEAGASWKRAVNPAQLDSPIRRRNPRQDDYRLAWELRDYLNQVPQPEDFPYLIRDWSGDEEDYRDLDELDDEERAAFAKWLAKSDAMRLELLEIPHEVPAYVFFRDAKTLGENAWCVHFTNAQAFDAFDRGANLAMLALSTHYRRKETARCDVNLDDETPIEERVYAFAYPAKDVSTPEGAARGRRRYGRNAVLFQTDAAVSALHVTDKERQALFPVCSERNLHAIRFEDERVVLLGSAGQELHAFPTLPALIKHLNAQLRKAAKRGGR